MSKSEKCSFVVMLAHDIASMKPHYDSIVKRMPSSVNIVLEDYLSFMQRSLKALDSKPNKEVLKALQTMSVCVTKSSKANKPLFLMSSDTTVEHRVFTLLYK